MRRDLSGLAVLAALAVLGTLLPGTATSATDPAGGFRRVPCPEGVFPADRDVDCGYIVVPQDRDEPTGETIRVAAAVVHATVPDPGEPIMFLDGGPSFGAISPFALGAYFADWPTADEHDLVLVDTRGTGLSRPRLGCRELDRAAVRAFYAGTFVNDKAPQIFRRSLGRCWERLTSRGIDPSDFNTAESAADLEQLRRALGIEEWNLLAISADGILGLTYLRRFPGGIRSAMIDSGMSNTSHWGLDYHRGTAEILDQVFAGCRADEQCRTTYPSLRRLFLRQVRRLNADPVFVTIPRFRPEPVTLLVDGAGIFADALNGLYPGDADFPSTVPDVLDFMWDVAHGRLHRTYRRLLGTGPVVNEHRNAFFALGKSMSYICRDYVRFITGEDRREAAAAVPAYAERFLRKGFDLAAGWADPLSPAGCRHWPVGRARPVQHELVVSPVAALVLANSYDLGVPARMVRPMLEGLSRSTYVELPAGAHLSLAVYTNGSECARQIATAFLADPGEPLDTSCVEDLPGLDFTPRTTVSEEHRGGCGSSAGMMRFPVCAWNAHGRQDLRP